MATSRYAEAAATRFRAAKVQASANRTRAAQCCCVPPHRRKAADRHAERSKRTNRWKPRRPAGRQGIARYLKLLGASSFEVCQLAENLEASINFVARERLQPFGAEALDGKRSHYTAIEQGAFDDLAV